MAGAPEAADPSPDGGSTRGPRFALVRSVGEECMQEGELMNLLVKKTVPVCYDGFEPSGRMHIAQCNIRDIQSWTGSYEGDRCEQADFSWVHCENMDCQLNNKMGGDLKKIQTVGRCLIEI
ncbi:hypothetical protein C4D60_Mb02t09140 [Musa balbisiana]|uniref:tyrosine--tRNA ligase n=1 Tax=Musa balbisiana TaxID=52838 RepID=A0A4V4H2J6_MUSBA|nr:hypothetical protein C4D60_Mb02t09140 [Musa balbisiana]